MRAVDALGREIFEGDRIALATLEGRSRATQNLHTVASFTDKGIVLREKANSWSSKPKTLTYDRAAHAAVIVPHGPQE